MAAHGTAGAELEQALDSLPYYITQPVGSAGVIFFRPDVAEPINRDKNRLRVVAVAHAGDSKHEGAQAALVAIWPDIKAALRFHRVRMALNYPFVWDWPGCTSVAPPASRLSLAKRRAPRKEPTLVGRRKGADWVGLELAITSSAPAPAASFLCRAATL